MKHEREIVGEISIPEGAMGANNCVSHPEIESVSTCDKCESPICESCYSAFTLEDDGEEYHFCADCYKGFVKGEIEEAKDLKKMIVKEFVGIAFGMLIGLLVGLFLGLKSSILTWQIVLPILGVFVGGSFVTIVKKIYNGYQENKDRSGDDSAWFINLITILFITIGCLIASPFTTLYRIIIRAIDNRSLDEMITSATGVLSSIDEFVARVGEQFTEQTVGAAALTAAAEGTDVGEEISLDAIIGEGFEIADNGEFLRKVRMR